jgi:hypothetical protein
VPQVRRVKKVRLATRVWQVHRVHRVSLARRVRTPLLSFQLARNFSSTNKNLKGASHGHQHHTINRSCSRFNRRIAIVAT